MALQAYRNILRAIRVAFKDDQTLASAARQQTRAAFLSSTPNPFSNSSQPPPPTSCTSGSPPRRRKNPFTTPAAPTTPPTIEQLIEHANQVAKVLRENVVQGTKVGEVVKPVSEVEESGPLNSSNWRKIKSRVRRESEGGEGAVDGGDGVAVERKEKEVVVPVFKLRIHEEIERGDNELIKNPDTGETKPRRKETEADKVAEGGKEKGKAGEHSGGCCSGH